MAAKALLAKGQKVRVLARNADRLQSLAAAGAEPFAAELTDAAALAKAFADAQAVYAMVPPDMASTDYRAFQNRVVDAMASALEQTRVKHVVALSSFGADKAEKTGPVAGLHYLEERFKRIPGLNGLYLRAGYFMENTLPQIGVIQTMGAAAGPLRADLKLPMIATPDIGAFAAAALLTLDFNGHQSRELLGQRDLTMAEAATIIGNAIGKPGLGYIQLPDSTLRGAMTQMGMSANMAGLLLEMAAALNSGHMKALERRSEGNTTPTSLETFVADEFLPRFRGKSAKA